MAVASSAEKIVCPKCGFEQYKRSAICKKCGLIFDKWREAQSKREKADRADKKGEDKAQAPAAAPDVPNVAARRLLMLIGLIAALGMIGYRMLDQKSRVAPRPSVVTQPAGSNVGGGTETAPRGSADLPGVRRRNPGGSPGVTTGAPGPGLGRIAPTLDAEYDQYLGDLAVAVDALGEFENQLRQGVSLEDVNVNFLNLRRELASLAPPDPTFVSYRAIDKAQDAYAESLKFWEYHAYSRDWEGKLWCADGTCPFETEGDLRNAVQGYINTAWAQATRMRSVATQYLNSGDPRSLEADAQALETLAEVDREIDGLWSNFRARG